MGIEYMLGQYDYRLVALGVVVAMLAAYTTLDLAGRVTSARCRGAHGWLVGGAVAMGTGFWSMHFVAMLAFKLPIPMGHDFGLTALSWSMAVLASAIALSVVSHSALTRARLVLGAVAMAAGIGTMHYIGMYAMRMQPAIVYDLSLVVASVAVAVAVSAATLWLSFKLRGVAAQRYQARKLAAAMAMGLALSGVHYTAMAAAHFPLDGVGGAAMALNTSWLATLVGISTILLLGIALVASVLDRQLEAQTSELVQSLRHANAELRHRNLHDPLTDLPNRTLLHERIEQSLARWRSVQMRFAVVYVDLDGFKALNDNLGHAAGDQFLQRVAKALLGRVRHNDTVARLGGDEFVLVINNINSLGAVDTVCAKLLETVASVPEMGVGLTASIGYALCPEDGEDAAQLVSAADVAMYATKLAGKNGYQSHSRKMASGRKHDFRIRNELGAALKAGHLTVHYQPKFATGKRTLTGAEALVRWQHPDKGLIPPGSFIPVAERCGLIAEVEGHVLAMVCAQIRAWLDAGRPVPPISINLSAIRVRDANLPEQIQACLDEHGLTPGYLQFEITESLAMDDVEQAVRMLNRLSTMGIGLALDDFGTGHSSLSSLKSLPINEVKIDRSFVADLRREATEQFEIVRSIVGLAHALRLQVVGEGVENEEQLTLLTQLGCDQVQGYLLGRPVPAATFAGFIARADEPTKSDVPADAWPSLTPSPDSV